MGEQGEYLTVPDFAERAGVTKAGVYNRIKNGDLEEYIKLDSGVKTVSIDAIKLFTPRKQGKVDKVEYTELSILELEVKYSQEKVERLESTISTLQDQLSILDNQLQVKDIQIANKDKQIEDLNDLVKTVTGLVDQAQRLDAAGKVEKIVSLPAETKKWYQFWK
jgi:myosin heavy subunit